MSRERDTKSGLPRTTTTGDSEQDFRGAGKGAIEDPAASVHHAEDDVLFANTKGFTAAWKARLRRRRAR